MFKNSIGLCLLALGWSPLAIAGDPTLPGNLPQLPQAGAIPSDINLNLSGILITENGKRAIINGQTLKPGQYLNEETRLIYIQPGRAVVSHRGSLETLKLVPSVKQQLK